MKRRAVLLIVKPSKGRNSPMTKDRKRVAVAMSGGIDSSVAACLLVREGHEVIGVSMGSGPPHESEREEMYPSGCRGVSSVEHARKVAAGLGIPFHVIRLEREFNREVVDYFCDEYLQGRTPNPCVVCNKKLKFGRLWEEAERLGARCIATGHYARVEYHGDRHRYLLRKGIDARKDQSYVLFALSQEQLSRVEFPLGSLHKDRVKEIVRDFGLMIGDRPESQETCFTLGRDYRCFLQSRFEGRIQSGLIVDREGRVLGSHDGISGFTIGQRRGLGIAAGYPLYVIDLDQISSRVIVGSEKETFRDRCIASRVNWIALESLTAPQTVKAKIRYNHPGIAAMVDPIAEDAALVEFDRPQKAVTPGQAVVFYEGDVVLGGGWIERSGRVGESENCREIH